MNNSFQAPVTIIVKFIQTKLQNCNVFYHVIRIAIQQQLQQQQHLQQLR